MVVGKLWRRNNGTARTWTIYFRWHTQCWIDQGVQKLEREPVVDNRALRQPKFSQEVTEGRVKVMRRRAAVVQRIRIEVDKPREEQSVDRIIHLGELLNKLREEIEQFGGVPESWN